jgi:hypothetical protein
MIKANFARFSRSRDLGISDGARYSFSQENHTKRKERIKAMKNACDEPPIKQFDNPFILKGNKKMIVNLHKIIPRSLSEEKARARHKAPYNQLLTFKENKNGLDNSVNSVNIDNFKMRDPNQYH